MPTTLSPVPTGTTISFYALGCKANQEEMECLVSRLAMDGFRVVPFGEPADWTVVNTCTVTQAADSDSRQVVRGATRRKSSGRVIVTGCLAQRDAAGLSTIPGVDWVVGNGEKPHLARMIHDETVLPASVVLKGPRILVGADPTLTHFAEYGTSRDGRRQRATLKIQDGCDEHCTFCIIPSVRGKSRSRPLDALLREVETLVAGGYREIALTGINTALWGRDTERSDAERGRPRELPDLIDALAGMAGRARVRLNSLEAQYVRPDWVDRFADSPVLCRHFHLPLQSGDATVLRRMNRRYTPPGYAELVERIHTRMPDAAIGCDVMVGFPGESARAFDETERFLDSLPLAYAHVFTYSDRPGTAAPRLALPVEEREKKRRSTRLRALAARIRGRFAATQVGARHDVLFEGPSGPDHWQGLTGNYLRVRVPWNHRDMPPQAGRTVASVLLTGIDPDGVMTGRMEDAGT